MALTFNSKTYKLDQVVAAVASYFGALKGVGIKDDVTIRRDPAKATATFSGLSQGTCKLTRTLPLTGAKTPTGDATFTVSVKMPVGAVAADVTAFYADGVALAAHQAVKDAVNGTINQG